ncbi:hypothetical protein [Paenirhodobacter sp.]|uniref:hypothetical protein n=1 Tax=Paenirhodobacter sp. TaxID=1965326 RepID=UPI003B3FCCA3
MALASYNMGGYTIKSGIGEALEWIEERIEWVADGKPVSAPRCGRCADRRARRAVTEAPGVCHASCHFVAGDLVLTCET